MKSYTAFNLAAMASTVAAHGYLKSPAPRMPGEAMKAACGQQVYTTFSSDINGNMQGALQNPGEGFDNSKCNIWTCKGMQFEDNKDNVQSWTAGQKVPIEVNIAAPHTGVANLTIIDTATSSPIGEPLISWTEYASTARGVQANETSFDITIPSDLGSKCAEAGACTLQWWWDARDIDQTYEACIDFTVGGSGAAPAPSASASAPASSAPASSAPATSAAAPAPSSEAPAPSSAAPAPSSAAPAPSSAAPAPSSAAPAPSSAAPAPSSAAPAPSSAAPAPTTIQTSFKPAPTGGAVTDAAAKYARCGGQGYEGPTTCADNWVCKEWNSYYSQCVESA